jgi:hypothetical protein
MIIGALFFPIIFIIIWLVIEKKYISEKRFDSNKSDFEDKLYKELEIFYHIEKSSNKLILKTEKIEDLITKGTLIIEVRNKDDPSIIRITYKRKVKLVGHLIIFLGICFCYVGALFPLLLIQETKKQALNEIDRIFFTIKSIN